MNYKRFLLQQGFTLIELIIALAILSLITLLLFTGLHLGSHTWETMQNISEKTDELRSTQGYLLRLLSQIRSLSVKLEDSEVAIFGGDNEHLEFAAPLSEYVGIAGIYVIQLTLEGNGKTRDLILTRWLIHPEILKGNSEVPAWKPLEEDHKSANNDLPFELDRADGAFGRTRLLANVAVFSITYYGMLDGESDPTWHDQWINQTSLPQLINLRLATTAQTWPDLVIALPISSSTSTTSN